MTALSAPAGVPFRRGRAWTCLAWRRLDAPGLETCRAVLDVPGEARGVSVARDEGAWIALRWHVAWDAAWRTRRVSAEALLPASPGGGAALALESDGEGRWREPGGRERPDLEGCLDADLSVTPFTNTLALRRLGLPPGGTAALRAVYVQPPAPDAPGPTASASAQRYTCRSRDAEGSLWRYEGEPGVSFEGIACGPDGVVRHYPGLFERIEP